MKLDMIDCVGLAVCLTHKSHQCYWSCDHDIDTDWLKLRYSFISTKIGTLWFSSIPNAMVDVSKLSVAMVTKRRPLIGQNLDILQFQ